MFTGYIYEFQFHNVTLTDAEIFTIMNSWNGTPAMGVSTRGCVGIGTVGGSSPEYLLDVNGSAAVGDGYNIGVARFKSTTALYGCGITLDATNLTGGKACSIWTTGGIAGEGQGKLLLGSIIGVQNAPLTVDITNARVGVQTNSPGYTLDVSGTQRVTGAQYVTSAGNQITRRYISNTLNQSTAAYSYTTFNGTYNNAYTFTYTRVNQASTLEIIADLQLSHAIGAGGTYSYSATTGRLQITSSSSGSTNTTDETRSWFRTDNGFSEITNTKRIVYTLSDSGSFATTGATITVYVQVKGDNNTGTVNRYGINLWGERSFVYVNEYV